MNSQFKFAEKQKSIMKHHKGPVFVVRFSKDGNYCMSGSQDRTINLLNPSKGLHIRNYYGPHNYEVFDLAITEDNGRFVSVGGDKLVFLWDVTTGKTIRKFQGHDSRINTCAWNKDNTVIVTGSYDATMKFWDCRSNSAQFIEELKNFKDSVSKIIISDEQVIASCIDGFIRTFDIRMGEIICDRINRKKLDYFPYKIILKEAVSSFSLSHDKKCLALSCLDSKLRLYDRDTGEILTDFIGFKSDNYSIENRFSKDDGLIITGSEDAYLYIYNVLQKYEAKLKGHSRTVCTLETHPRDNSFISGSFDGSVCYWSDN